MSALGSMDEDEWSLRQRRKTEILAGVPTNDLLKRAKAQLAQARAEEAHEKEVRTARELVRMRDETEAAHEIMSKLECTRARLAREEREARRREADRLAQAEVERQGTERNDAARRAYREEMQSSHGKARREHACPQCAEPFSYQLTRRSWSIMRADAVTEYACANWLCQHHWSVALAGSY
jgi:hypothetical protein